MGVKTMAYQYPVWRDGASSPEPLAETLKKIIDEVPGVRCKPRDIITSLAQKNLGGGILYFFLRA